LLRDKKRGIMGQAKHFKALEELLFKKASFYFDRYKMKNYHIKLG